MNHFHEQLLRDFRSVIDHACVVLRHPAANTRTLVSALSLSVLVMTGPASGQNRPSTQPRNETATDAVPTIIEVEVLLPSGVTGLNAQRWGRALSDLRIQARFRPPIVNDKPEVSESQQGRTRIVKLVGQLEADGCLSFPGRRFTLSEGARLGEWLRELKTYGSQGADDGQPGFGLSPSQFNVVFGILEQAVEGDIAGRPLNEALDRIGLPDSLPVRMTPAATEALKATRSSTVADAGLTGLSRGTVLSILLNNAGLAFRPGRTPAGNLELRVVPLTGTAGVWPVGWPLEKAPLHAMPKLVEIIPVELKSVPLSDVLTAASRQTETRILTDGWRLKTSDVELNRILVNQPLKKMTWSGLLDRATFPTLMRELLQDEAGRPFIWITTRTTAQLNARQKQREALYDVE